MSKGKKRNTIPFKSKPQMRPQRADMHIPREPQIPDTPEGQIEYLQGVRKSYMETLEQNNIQLMELNVLAEKVIPNEMGEFAIAKNDPNYEMNRVQFANFLLHNMEGISHVEFIDAFSADAGGTMFTRVRPVMREELKKREDVDYGIQKLSVQDLISMLIYNIDRSIEGLENFIKEQEVAANLPELSMEDAMKQIDENTEEPSKDGNEENVSEEESSDGAEEESEENVEEDATADAVNDLEANAPAEKE